MAERMVLVCDVDSKEPATQTVRIQVGRRTFSKDLCKKHLDELLRGARSPRRGRKVSATRKTRIRKRATARKSTTRRTRQPTSTWNVAAEVRKLRERGLTYRQVGEALIERGIKPQRAKAWNPVVLGRIVKTATA